MLSLEIIKQTMTNNSNKGVSPLLLKKTIESSFKNDLRINLGYEVSSITRSILEADFSEEEKTQLFSELKEKMYKDYEDTKKDLEDLFGSLNKEAE